MKTTLLLLFTTLFATSLNAQIVNIPDPNFKNALIQSGIDTNEDGEIQYSEAEAVTGLIQVSNQDIADLTGIQAFVNITELNCTDNQLTQLDVSQNPVLELLWCQGNPLIQLDVSLNIGLETLFCDGTLLTELDMSNNIHLIYLDCKNTQLTKLDLRNGTYEVEIIAVNNPYLTCIFVDDVDAANNASWWYKDPTATYVETQAECDALAAQKISSLNK